MNGSEFARISGKYSTIFIGTYQLTGQNTTGNYSNFKIRVYGYYGGGTSTGSSYGTIWISGTQYNIGGYRLYPGYTLLAEKDITVYHNNDGSFPYTTQAFDINSYHANGEVSGAISAPSIARYANITRADNFNDEQNPVFYFTNPANFWLTFKLEVNGNTDFIKRENVANAGSPYTLQLTDDERKKLRQAAANTNSLGVRFTIGTSISGSIANWSYLDRTMSIVNANPIFENFNYEDINSKTLALTGNNKTVLKGYSSIKATIPSTFKATALKEASMSKYRIKIGEATTDISYNSTSDVSGTINNASSSTITCYAIDSRNNSTSIDKTAETFIEYNPITKGSISANRANGTSENINLSINGTYDERNFGLVTNSIKSSKYRYKSTDSSTWSEYQDITLDIQSDDSNSRFSFDGLLKGDTETFGFNIENSYQFEVLIEDELSSVTFTATVGSGIPNIALAKNGVGIMGKYDVEEGGLLQVGGKNILKRHMATAYPSSNIASYSGKISLNTLISNSSELTLSSGGIRIGKGISYVAVSGNVFIQAEKNDSYLWTSIRCNSTEISIAIDNYNTYYASTSHSPRIIEVKEGDIIYLWQISQAPGQLRSLQNTYLTVEVIE